MLPCVCRLQMGVHMRRRLGLASAAAALLLAAAASAALAPADYAALAAGVGTARTGSFVASRMVLWGGAPTAVAADDSRLPVAVVAAATLGSGRIVIFGHEGMFRECCGASGLPRLLGNAALWAGAPRRPPGGPIRVASEAGDPYGNAAGMRRKLVAQVGRGRGRVPASACWLPGSRPPSCAGACLQCCAPADNHRATPATTPRCPQFPAVFADAGAVPASQIAVAKAELFLADGQSAAAGQYAWAIRQFLRAGGGVVLGAQTWCAAAAVRPLLPRPRGCPCCGDTAAACSGCPCVVAAAACSACRLRCLPVAAGSGAAACSCVHGGLSLLTS